MENSRRLFLKNSAAALGLGATALATGTVLPAGAAPFGAVKSEGPLSETRPRPAGQKSVMRLTTKPLGRKVRIGVIG
ncbi:MAG: hypothetical protein LBT53_08290, partial [Puniceicoccales bacterium]|nr:hypothetical protein [Puniceicoccales bacterium]